MSAAAAPHRAEVNWAIVGTGFVSRSVAQDLRLTPGAARYAVCSRDQGRAQNLAVEHDFERTYDSLSLVLADPAVDVVYIATPHATHADLAIAALQAGKHVLIEKPIAVDAREGRRIADVAAASGCFAMEAMWMRFNPAYRGFVEAARTGAVGEPRSVRASFGLPFGPPESTRWSAERASSTLLDQGIYPVVLALDVLGRPSGVRAIGRVRDDGVDLTEHIAFDYADSAFAQLSASMVEFIEPTASVSGTDGWMTIPAPFWAADGFETRSGGIPQALTEPRSTRFDRQGNGYVPMLEAVTRAVADGLTEHPVHPLADSLAVLELLDDIRDAMTANAATDKETR